MPKRKRGPKSWQANKRVYKRGGWEAQLRGDLDKGKSKKTMELYRYGYKLMWQTAPEEMKKHSMGPLNSFHKRNGHNGLMYGWKRECNMTDNKAKRILRACYKKEVLSLDQLKAVRKSLAYSWQLMGKDDGVNINWPSVARTWKGVTGVQCPKDPTKSTLPLVIPTPQQLKKAFTTRWSPGSPMSFAKTVLARRGAHFGFLLGCRSQEDMKRLKNSRTHVINYNEGYMSTEFLGGRCKLAGEKKGNRPWWGWANCWCKNGKHKRPSPRLRYCLNKEGNPRNGEAPFDERCPLAGFEFSCMFEEDKSEHRLFPNIVKSTGTYGSTNTGDVIGLAIDWLTETSGSELRFSTNSGRKALAALCTQCDIPYDWSFEQHGDLPDVWEESYREDQPAHRGALNYLTFWLTQSLRKSQSARLISDVLLLLLDRDGLLVGSRILLHHKCIRPAPGHQYWREQHRGGRL